MQVSTYLWRHSESIPDLCGAENFFSLNVAWTTVFFVVISLHPPLWGGHSFIRSRLYSGDQLISKVPRIEGEIFSYIFIPKRG